MTKLFHQIDKVPLFHPQEPSSPLHDAAKTADMPSSRPSPVPCAPHRRGHVSPFRIRAPSWAAASARRRTETEAAPPSRDPSAQPPHRTVAALPLQYPSNPTTSGHHIRAPHQGTTWHHLRASHLECHESLRASSYQVQVKHHARQTRQHEGGTWTRKVRRPDWICHAP